MSNLPVVCVLGARGVKLTSPDCPPFEARDMDIRYHDSDKNFYEMLAKDRPQAIVSFGKRELYPILFGGIPEFVRRMWLHFDTMGNLDDIGSQVFNCFLHNAMYMQKDNPLVTVFTPAYLSGDKIFKPYRSLLAQTYKDWEWVLVDDSNDNGVTFDKLSKLADTDGRIRVYKESKPSGRIGTVKRTACGLARGSILVELDHDDEILPKALQWVVEAFKAHPESSFLYTDFTECDEGGASFVYGPGWGLGYGSYREETYGGIKYQVVNAPHINSKTIRHIIAAPNHIRAWRKNFYDSIGGHHDLIHVADDYDLILRSFLGTRILHLAKFCYVQYRNMDGSGNTSLGIRNKEIQRLVRYMSIARDEEIHQRFVELGVDDFMYQKGSPAFYRLLQVPNPSPEPHCSIIYEPQS